MVFRLLPGANMCAGGYDFHAYCKYENSDHKWDEFPHIPYGVETYGQATTALKKRGWVFHKDGYATCPTCAKRLKGGSK